MSFQNSQRGRNREHFCLKSRGEQRFSSVRPEPVPAALQGAGGPARLRVSGAVASPEAAWPSDFTATRRCGFACGKVPSSPLCLKATSPKHAPSAFAPSSAPASRLRQRPVHAAPRSPLITRPPSAVLRSTDRKAPRLSLQVHCDSCHSTGTGPPTYPSPGRHLPRAREKGRRETRQSRRKDVEGRKGE